MEWNIGCALIGVNRWEISGTRSFTADHNKYGRRGILVGGSLVASSNRWSWRLIIDWRWK
jgi:hypothetical protein